VYQNTWLTDSTAENRRAVFQRPLWGIALIKFS